MRHATRLTDHGDDHIGLLGRFDRFIDQHRSRTWVVDDFRRIEVEEVQVIEDGLVVGDVGAFGIDHLGLVTEHLAHAFAHGHRLLWTAGGGPAAHHVDRCIGQRPDQGDGAGLFQWQGLLAVFQQHHAAARHVTRFGTVQAVFGVGIGRVVAGLADATVRVGEQAHVVLGAKHFTHGVVDIGLVDFAGLEQAGQF